MQPDERLPLNKTDLMVTRLSLGTVPLGNLYQGVTDEEAQDVLDACWESGIRMYDTAPVYGYGIAERRLATALAKWPRSEYVLSTKVGRLLLPDAPPQTELFHESKPMFVDTPPVNPVFDFSYDGAMRSFESSLERLKVEHVNIVYIQGPDNHYDEAINGAYRALDQLRSEGVIDAVGAGMNQSQMLARFAVEGDFDCFLLAGRYTLLDQSGLADLLPLCEDKGISVIIGGVYNSGILANPSAQATYNYIPAAPEMIERALKIQAVCDRYGVPLKAAALQFPLGHPAVTSILTGVRSVSEINENVAMFQMPIPPDLWAELKAKHLLPQNVQTPSSV